MQLTDRSYSPTIRLVLSGGFALGLEMFQIFFLVIRILNQFRLPILPRPYLHNIVKMKANLGTQSTRTDIYTTWLTPKSSSIINTLCIYLSSKDEEHNAGPHTTHLSNKPLIIQSQ